MAQDREGPVGNFKRVLTLAMKTIADEPELSVTFGNEPPALQGSKAKLPQVSNELTPAEIAVTRGLSDSFALRLGLLVGRHLDDLGLSAPSPRLRGEPKKPQLSATLIELSGSSWPKQR